MMKKTILFALVAIMAVLGARAEKGDLSIAAQFNYSSKNSMAGFGAQLQYEPIQNLRFAPEFIYYLKNDGLSANNFNFNVHYIIPTGNTFALYPMAGFSYAKFKYDHSVIGSSFNRCGANIGFGAQYRIQEGLYFFIEQRFQIIKDRNQSVSVLGVKYAFHL